MQSIGRVAYKFARNWIPDPLVFALLLTLIAFLFSMAFSPQNDYEANGAAELLNAAGRLIGYWQGGFWDLLAFSMQMALILVLGGALASSKPVNLLITRLARLPKSGASAAMLVSFVACVAAWLNWGLGLIVGAMMARRVAKLAIRRRIVVHYPLLGAAGYTGLMVWHGGLSGSGPLAMNTPNSELVRAIGEPLTLHQTILSPMNLVMTAVLITVIPVICYFLAPRYRGGDEIDLDLLPDDILADDSDYSEESPPSTPAQHLERSRILTVGFSIAALLTVAWQLADDGFTLEFLNLNSVNFILLFTGMALHGSVSTFMRAIGDVAKTTGGIIVQFPFYAGIMAMVIDSGTIVVWANAITSVVNEYTFAVGALFSASIVNLFVPSGGGQIAVQGPFIYEVTKQLNVPFEIGFMAVCYGDQLTNMLQPFWALPLLGFTGLKARDLIGYTVTIMLFGAVIMILVLTIFTLLAAL